MILLPKVYILEPYDCDDEEHIHNLESHDYTPHEADHAHSLSEKYKDYILYEWKFSVKRIWVPWALLLIDTALFITQFFFPKAASLMKLACIFQFILTALVLLQLYQKKHFGPEK